MAGRTFPGSTGYEPFSKDTMAADASKVKTNRVGKTTHSRSTSKVGDPFGDEFSELVDADGDIDFTIFPGGVKLKKPSGNGGSRCNNFKKPMNQS